MNLFRQRKLFIQICALSLCFSSLLISFTAAWKELLKFKLFDCFNSHWVLLQFCLQCGPRCSDLCKRFMCSICIMWYQTYLIPDQIHTSFNDPPFVPIRVTLCVVFQPMVLSLKSITWRRNPPVRLQFSSVRFTVTSIIMQLIIRMPNVL